MTAGIGALPFAEQAAVIAKVMNFTRWAGTAFQMAQEGHSQREG